MSLRADRRAQSIQIGALLLFAVLIILFATYQAFVIPDQNRGVEANHLDTVTGQLLELRNTIVSVPGGDGGSVSITLGTTYPSRVIGLNPPPPTGSIRTAGTGTGVVNLTVANARATDDEVRDRWDGTNRSFNSGLVRYRPGYHEFRDAPTVVYENSLLYHRFRGGNLTKAGQRFVDGSQLRLVTINGSLSRTATETVAVDVAAVSSSTRRITIENETNQNVILNLASQYSPAQWRDELRATGEFTDQGGHVVSVTGSSIPGSPFDVVHIELERGQTYTLQMAKVGLGTGATDPPVAYLTDVAGDGASLEEGSSVRIVIEPRDALNNPVAGVTVNGSVESAMSSGQLVENTVQTDEDGRAVFEYEADQIDGVSQRRFDVNFSFDRVPGADFDESAPLNVSTQVTVQNTDSSGLGAGGGGSAYATTWLDPSGQTGVTCPNGADGTCTVDASQTGTVTLTMQTSPTAVNAEVDYSLNDTDIGSLDPLTGETDSSGGNSTNFSPIQEGPVKVFTSSGGSGDTLVLNVINVVQNLVFNNDATAEDGPDGDSVTGGVEFTMTNQYSQSLEITEVEVGDPSGPTNVLDDQVTPNDEPERTELYVEADSNDGWVDLNGGTDLPFTFDLDSSGFSNNGNPTATSGSTLRFYLYEFEQNNGDRVDMTDESFEVTVSYELADGTTDTTTMTVTPS